LCFYRLARSFTRTCFPASLKEIHVGDQGKKSEKMNFQFLPIFLHRKVSHRKMLWVFNIRLTGLVEKWKIFIEQTVKIRRELNPQPLFSVTIYRLRHASTEVPTAVNRSAPLRLRILCFSLHCCGFHSA
jgi:hypothetical protein